MKKTWMIGGLAASALVAFLACTSNSSSAPPNGGNSCQYNIAAELQYAAGAGSTCASCINASCSAQVSEYQGSAGCGGYLSCVCPGGTATTNSATIQGCESQASQQSCTTASQDFNTCISTNCQAQCHNSGSSSGGSGGSSGGSGGSSGSSSGGSATLDPGCQTYYNCCLAEFASAIDAGDGSAIQQQCLTSAQSSQQQYGSDQGCVAETALLQDAGIACQ